jgi:hypothetical protein
MKCAIRLLRYLSATRILVLRYMCLENEMIRYKVTVMQILLDVLLQVRAPERAIIKEAR